VWARSPVYLPAGTHPKRKQTVQGHAKVHDSEHFTEAEVFARELIEFSLESLILAQDERWRRA
jgi:hypothetical protein